MIKEIEQISEIIKDINIEEVREKESHKIYEFFKDLKLDIQTYIQIYETIEEFKKKYNLSLSVNDFDYRGKPRLKTNYGTITIFEWRDGCYLPNSQTQPKIGETIIEYNFPTGPYIFLDNCNIDYDEDFYCYSLFEEFTNEIEKYKPKYKDDVNKSYLFDFPEGVKLYKNFESICEKYQKEYNAKVLELKTKETKKEIEELEERLKSLKGEE